jgi:Holliday junction resolvase RusA-like endonuclease
MSCIEENGIIKLTLDQSVLDKYNKYYFLEHPKANKIPIEHPYHPSINTWIILPRIQMNALKQKWKDFVKFWMKLEKLENRQLDNFDIILTVYFNTKRRHDTDNQVPKFILDGFTESGFIVDDDEKHLHSLTLKTGYDKENPRTEIEVIVHNN